MREDKPLLGILLMFGFCVVAPMGDAVAKLLGGTVPIGQLLLGRFGVQLLLLAPLVYLTGRAWRMSGLVLSLTFLRTLLHILGIGMMVAALVHLPLADAIAIAFVLPFLMLLLGKLFLGEEVGARRLWACLVGFCGTLMVVQPAFAEVGWPALLPLGVAVNFAVFMLVTRQIAQQTDPIGLQAVSGAMAVIVILPVLLLVPGTALPTLRLEPMSGATWGLLVLLGGFGTLAHLLMTWSLRYAPSATLAPMQYLEIPFATLIGWVVFGDLPNGLASAGIAVTLAAGLYIVMRERAISRRSAAVRPATDPMSAAAE